MGAAALQKYIGSLGGIGTPGVGSSSSYAPKELNKEVMPEKVNLLFHCQMPIMWLELLLADSQMKTCFSLISLCF